MENCVLCTFKGDYTDIEPVVFLFLLKFQERVKVRQAYVDDTLVAEMIVDRTGKNQCIILDLARRCHMSLIESLFIPECKKFIWTFSRLQ